MRVPRKSGFRLTSLNSIHVLTIRRILISSSPYSFAEGTSSYASAYGLSVPPATPSHYGNRSLNSSYAPPVVPPAAAAATSAFNSSNPVDASQSFGHGSSSASSIAHQHSAQQLTRIEPSAPAPQQPPPGTGRSPYAYQVPTKPQTADVPGAVEPIVRSLLCAMCDCPHSGY